MTTTKLPSPGPLEPGALVAGRFRLDRILGEGGMGSVWLARDADLGDRPVALKLLRPGLAGGEVLSRFRREARTMARLRHPNLVEIFDARLDGDLPYIAQEFVPGESLHALVGRRGPLEPAAALSLARQLALALAALHAAGVVHRDVKPANVMVEPGGRARLTDLGLAVADDSTRLTAEGAMLGTVLYLAPEMAVGEGGGPPLDVFAFGLTLWEAATGRHPFAGAETSAAAYLQRLVAGAVPAPAPPAAMPPALAATLTAALRLDADERPRDGAALLALLDGRGPAPTPPAPSPTPRPPSPGRRLALPACLVLLVAALVATRPAPPPAPPPAAPPAATAVSPAEPPTIRVTLDGVTLAFPSQPPPGTSGRLLTPDGDLLVERPFRGPLLTLAPPHDAPAVLRWGVTDSEPAFQGSVETGFRTLFDGRLAAHGLAGDDPIGKVNLAAPLVVRGDRVAAALTRATVHLLALDHPPGAPPGLVPVAAIPLTDRFPTGSLTALLPLGENHLLTLVRGKPSVLATLTLSPPALAAATPLDRLVVENAHGAPLPGGGAVLAAQFVDARNLPPRRRCAVAFWPGPPAPPVPDPLVTVGLPGDAPPVTAHLPLVQVVPLAGPVRPRPDEAHVLVLHEADGRSAASVVAWRGTTAEVLTSLAIPTPFPAVHPGLPDAPWARLPDGSTVVGLSDRLIRVDPALGLRLHDPGLPPGSRVALVLPRPDGPLDLLVASPAAPPAVNPVRLVPHRLRPGALDGPTVPSPGVLLVERGLDRILPMTAAPLPDGGLLLALRSVAALLGPAPDFPCRRETTFPRDDTAHAVAMGDTVLVAARTGRIYGVER